jgi:hypothetical protein
VTETFEYRSPSRAVSAPTSIPIAFCCSTAARLKRHLDPGSARTAASRWSARWMIWLEDALLTYVALT